MTDLAKQIQDLQGDAVVLAGMINAIDLLECEPDTSSGRVAVVIAAKERSQKLADDLDKLEVEARK